MAVVEPAWSAKPEAFITSKIKKKQKKKKQISNNNKTGAELDLLQFLLDKWTTLSTEVK